MFKPLKWKNMGGMMHSTRTVNGSYLLQETNNVVKVTQTINVDNSVYVRVKHPDLHKVDIAKAYVQSLHVEALKKIVEDFHTKPKLEKKKVFPYKKVIKDV